MKSKALIAAYATKDGKAAIDKFTGGKALVTKDAAVVDAIFVGASEILKETRTKEFSKTKSMRSVDAIRESLSPKGAMTPEQVNEANEKHYGRK